MVNFRPQSSKAGPSDNGHVTHQSYVFGYFSMVFEKSFTLLVVTGATPFLLDNF